VFANATGIPISTGISGLGTGIATFLATPSSANLASALTDETGSGANVFATSPTLVTPVLGTPSSGTLTSCTGLPISTGVSGLGTGVATALAVNVGTAGAPVVNGGALGTPSSGTVTNLTGTASININGTVGATTPSTVAGTTIGGTRLSASGDYVSNGGDLTLTNTNGGRSWRIGDGIAGVTSSLVIFDATGSAIVGKFTSTGLNSTAIGATTPSTGAFTTLSASGLLSTAAGFQFRGADATAYELLRYSGGTNNPGIFVKVNEATRHVEITASGSSVAGQKLRLGAEGTIGIAEISSTGLAVTGALSASGVFSASAGSLAAPSISFTGDTDTGLFQSTDVLNVSVGGVNAGIFNKQFGGAGLQIDNTTIASLLVSSGTHVFQVLAQSGGIAAGTRSNEDFFLVTNDTVRATISSTGNVGIGTASPTAKLHVDSGTQKLVKSVSVNSSTQTIVTNSTEGVSGLCWIRDASVGGQALVLWDISHGLTIVSQLGSIFTTSSPSATEIQLSVAGSSPYYVQAIAGATRNGDSLSTSAINNQ